MWIFSKLNLEKEYFVDETFLLTGRVIEVKIDDWEIITVYYEISPLILECYWPTIWILCLGGFKVEVEDIYTVKHLPYVHKVYNAYMWSFMGTELILLFKYYCD